MKEDIQKFKKIQNLHHNRAPRLKTIVKKVSGKTIRKKKQN